MITTSVAISETAWSNATTYGAAAIVRREKTGLQHRFESRAGGNLNNDPALDVDADFWLDLGAVNAHLMFDGIVQTQTEAAEEIDVSLDFAAGARADVVLLENLDAAEVRVVLTDAGDGDVFDETFDLLSTSGIVDFWEWCFEPVSYLTSIIITDLPPYDGAVLAVTILQPGGTARCGLLMAGFSRRLGTTQWGVGLGITDYSVKQTDDLGRMSVLQRAYAKRATFTINVEASFVDELATLLPAYRATPVLWVGDDSYASTAVWGFFREFAIEIAFPDLSYCSLEVEGLT
jgi:hypothetical protein